MKRALSTLVIGIGVALGGCYPIYPPPPPVYYPAAPPPVYVQPRPQTFARPRLTLPALMHWCAANCATLIWAGNRYVAQGTPFPERTPQCGLFVERFSPEAVILHRVDCPPVPGRARLTGRLSPAGNSIQDGVIQWTYHPCCGLASAPFQAAWGDALDQVPGSNWERDRRTQQRAQAQAQAPSRAPDEPRPQPDRARPQQPVDCGPAIQRSSPFKRERELEPPTRAELARQAAEADRLYQADRDAEAVQLYRRLASAGDAHALRMVGVCYIQGKAVTKDYREALRWLQRATAAGNLVSMTYIGWIYALGGNGVTANAAEALSWLRKAGDRGDASALYILGGVYQEGKLVPQDLGEAIRWWRRAAERGHGMAMNNLGSLYQNGRGVNQDDREAMRWYLAAAAAGEGLGAANVASMYWFGDGVAQSDGLAACWARKSADADDPNGMYQLGLLLTEGRIVPGDDARAFQLYRKAAEDETTLPEVRAAAMNNVGASYYHGRGTARDLGEALRWYRKAADAGESLAMANLGVFALKRTPPDEAEAVHWLRKAAELGESSAMYNLGFVYSQHQDYGNALAWYHKAADKGDAEAMNNIGACYHNGWGVQRSVALAMIWYQKAAARGNNLAKLNMVQVGAGVLSNVIRQGFAGARR